VHSFIKSFQVGGADDVYRRYLRKGRREGIDKKDTWRARAKVRERERERERDSRKIGNDVSTLRQLPWLLIKSADGRGGEGDRGARNSPGGPREINRVRWISKLRRLGPRQDMDTFRLETSAC